MNQLRNQAILGRLIIKKNELTHKTTMSIPKHLLPGIVYDIRIRYFYYSLPSIYIMIKGFVLTNVYIHKF